MQNVREDDRMIAYNANHLIVFIAFCEFSSCSAELILLQSWLYMWMVYRLLGIQNLQDKLAVVNLPSYEDGVKGSEVYGGSGITGM